MLRLEIWTTLCFYALHRGEGTRWRGKKSSLVPLELTRGQAQTIAESLRLPSLSVMSQVRCAWGFAGSREKEAIFQVNQAVRMEKA